MSDSTLKTRFSVPKGYAIPEADEARLRTILNLQAVGDKPPPELPDVVVGGYYAMKRCCDILGCAVSDWQIATVVCLALLSETGAVKSVELPPVMPDDFREIVRKNKVPMGALVACEWAGELRPGYFNGFAGDLVQVQISGTERLVDLSKVRMVKETEFVELPRNVNGR